MYSYISGQLVEVNEETIVVDNHGIGYEFFIPKSVVYQLPNVGGNVKIYTYLYVREDAMQFFGFRTKEELALFKLLIGVNGIGPKGALAVLGVLSAQDLRFAILAEDAKAIAAAPGIGSKTAQRVIIDLKDKIDQDGCDRCNDLTRLLGIPGTACHGRYGDHGGRYRGSGLERSLKENVFFIGAGYGKACYINRSSDRRTQCGILPSSGQIGGICRAGSHQG